MRARLQEGRTDGADFLAVSIACLFGSGIWLCPAPRTFQLLMGLMLNVLCRQPVHLHAMGSVVDQICPPLVLRAMTRRIRCWFATAASGLVLTRHRESAFATTGAVSGASSARSRGVPAPTMWMAGAVHI